MIYSQVGDRPMIYRRLRCAYEIVLANSKLESAESDGFSMALRSAEPKLLGIYCKA